MGKHRSIHLILMSVVLSLLAVALACGGDDTATPRATSTSGSPTATSPAPTPSVRDVMANPDTKGGGILRIATSVANPSHFDLAQSTTVGNLEPQGLMYNGLLRPSIFDGANSIIPDLASDWKISADGLSFTFDLREGVKFHDGALLTADDVVASFSRIIFPPEDVVSTRKTFYTAVKEVKALDPLTVEFVLDEPRGIVLSAIASEWSIINRKQSLEDNNFDLKRVNDAPGTGAFQFVNFVSGEKWELEAFGDYWNEGLPYLQGVELLHVPGAQIPALVLTGRADYGFRVSPLALGDAIDKGLNGSSYVSAGRRYIAMNWEVEPLDDIRVRRAIDLVVDRHALINATADVVIMKLARWVLPGTPYALSNEELLKHPSLVQVKTEAIREAKALMEQAGLAEGFGPVSIVYHDIKGGAAEREAAALQQMLKVHLNIETTLTPTDRTVAFEVMRAGDFAFAVAGSASPVFDPSGYMNEFFHSTGGQNWSRYSSAEADALLDQLGQELDLDKRIQIVRQLEVVFNRDIPEIWIGSNNLNDIWHTYVKDVPSREAAGPYGLRRWDTVWMDN